VNRTGASAIQFVPAIQPQVEKLHVFQRTAPWIVKRHDRPFARLERKRLSPLPMLQRVMRAGIYSFREVLGLPFVIPWAMKLLQPSPAPPQNVRFQILCCARS